MDYYIYKCIKYISVCIYILCIFLIRAGMSRVRGASTDILDSVFNFGKK